MPSRSSTSLISLWARLYKYLIGNYKTAAFALDIVGWVDVRARPGCVFARVIAKHPKGQRLNGHELTAAARAASDDWRAVKVGQDDLLAHRSRSLPALLEAFPQVSEGPPIDDGLRPRFQDVRDDFISHHTDTTGPAASRLAKALHRRGRNSWLAQEEIPRPAMWNGRLLPAIENCAEFILLMNRAASDSARVCGECHHALDHKRRVIAVALEPDVRPIDFDIGFAATQVKVIAWYAPLETDDHASALADLIIRVIEADRDAVVSSDQASGVKSDSPA